VSAPWQTGLNMGSTIGAIFGELLDLTEPVVVID
jgi:hypothetical protein